MSSLNNLCGQEIMLEESPYTYARTTAMRSLLIPKSKYPQFLKMSIAEISVYLSETEYKNEISELGVELSGIELIEQVLHRNFTNTIQKLKRISPEEYRSLIDTHLLHYDIDNLKTLIRAKFYKISDKEAMKLIFPVSILSQKAIELLIKKDSIEELLKSLPYNLKKAYPRYRELKTKDLINIETMLDEIYFEELISFTKRLPEDAKLFKEFIYILVETANILTFFRLLKENMDIKDISQHMLFLGYCGPLLTKLVKAKTKEERVRIIEKSRYNGFISPKDIEDNGSLIPLEIALYRFTFNKVMHFSHQAPLSVYSILSYLFAKEIEIMNLKKILKAKILGISAEKVESQLVVL